MEKGGNGSLGEGSSSGYSEEGISSRQEEVQKEQRFIDEDIEQLLDQFQGRNGETDPFHVGCDDFAKIARDGSVLVDKTKLIKQIIDDPTRVLMFAKPRGSGKSTNLSMLRCFFERKVDSTGRGLWNYPFGKLFQYKSVGGGNWLRYLHHQGAYPVLCMSWRSLCSSTVRGMQVKMGELIKSLYRQHMYIVKNRPSQRNFDEYIYFQALAMQFNNIYQSDSGSVSVSTGFNFLCQMLAKYFNRRVYVLIDDCDGPFNYLRMRELGESDPERRRKLREEGRQVMRFIRGELNYMLSDESVVEKGILMCTFDIRDEKDTNYDAFFDVLDPRYGQFFGFSGSQIDQNLIGRMFSYSSETSAKISRVSRQLIFRLSQWYDGYSIFVENVEKYRFYNCFDVMSYLSECFMKRRICNGRSYWSLEGVDRYLQVFFQNQQSKDVAKILSLGLYDCAQFSLFSEVGRKAGLSTYENGSERQLGYLLLDAGYVTGCNKALKSQVMKGVISNKSVFVGFQQLFRKWIGQNIFEGIGCIEIEDAVRYNKQMLRLLCLVEDKIRLQNQKSFCRLFAIAYLLSKDQSHVVSDQLSPSWQGRTDLVFYPRNNKCKTVIIAQFEATGKSQELGVLRQKALQRIYQNSFFSGLLKEENNSWQIDKVVLRPIVVLWQPKVCLYMEEGDIVYSIDQALLLAQNSSRIKELIRSRKLDCRKLSIERDRFESLLIQILGQGQPTKQRVSKIERERRQKTEKGEFEVLQRSVKKMSIGQRAFCDLKAENFNSLKAAKDLPIIGGRLLKKTDRGGSKVQRFRAAFLSSNNLYDCKLEDLGQFFSETESRQIFSSLQQMKEDPRYFSCVQAKNEQVRGGKGRRSRSSSRSRRSLSPKGEDKEDAQGLFPKEVKRK